jgi:hypothetical protein
VHDTQGYGVAVQYSKLSGTEMYSDIRIEDVEIARAGRAAAGVYDGIDIKRARRIVIDRVKVHHNGGHGLHVRGQELNLGDVLAYDNGRSGVVVESAAYGATGTRLAARASASNVIAHGNAVHGIELLDDFHAGATDGVGTTVSLSSAHAHGNGLSGLRLGEHRFDVTVAGATFNKNGSHGIEITSVKKRANVSFASVSANENAADGIHLAWVQNTDTARLAVSGGNFIGNAGSGIHLGNIDGVLEAALTGINASDNRRHGLELASVGDDAGDLAEVSVSGSNFSHNGASGMVFGTVKRHGSLLATLSGVTCRENGAVSGGHGVMLSDVSGSAQLTLTAIGSTANHGAGLHVATPSSVSVSGSELANNRADGIYATHDGFSVSGSILRGNGGYAFNNDSLNRRQVVTGCTATANVAGGIRAAGPNALHANNHEY